MITKRDPFSDIFRYFFDTPDLGRWNNNIKFNENNEDYEMYFAIPGLKKEDINMEMDGSVLVIKHETKKDDKKNFTFVNFFEKRYEIPNDVDIENISAKVYDGILEIKLPKRKSVLKKNLIPIG